MKDNDVPLDLVARETAAGAVGVSLRTLDQAVKDGRLLSYVRGPRTLVSMSAVEEWRSARVRPVKPLVDVTFSTAKKTEADLRDAIRKAEVTFATAKGEVCATEDFGEVFAIARGAIPEAGFGFDNRKARIFAMEQATSLSRLTGVSLCDCLEFLVSGTLPGFVPEVK